MAETQQEMLRRLREQAWEEGYRACAEGRHQPSDNPHKKKT